MAKVKIDVEDLVVWALLRQCANVNRGQGIMQELRQLSGGSVSATGALEAYLSVGSRIDGGPGSSDHRTPADALKVAAAVDRLPESAAALVIVAGRTAHPIDWAEEGIGRWVAVKDRKGKHRKLWQDVSQSRGLLGWEWRWEGYTPDDLDFIRLQYWTWWHALIDLRAALEGQLTKWEVTGPRRSAEPWNDAPVVVHHAEDDAA